MVIEPVTELIGAFKVTCKLALKLMLPEPDELMADCALKEPCVELIITAPLLAVVATVLLIVIESAAVMVMFPEEVFPAVSPKVKRSASDIVVPPAPDVEIKVAT